MMACDLLFILFPFSRLQVCKDLGFFCLTFKIQETIFKTDSVLFILLFNQILTQAMTRPTRSISFM